MEQNIFESEAKTCMTAKGIVANCTRLRVRDFPDKDGTQVDVLCEGSEIQIDLENSTEDFYKIFGEQELYCMKAFVVIIE